MFARSPEMRKRAPVTTSDAWQKKDVADLWAKRSISDLWGKRDVGALWAKRDMNLLSDYLSDVTKMLNEK